MPADRKNPWDKSGNDPKRGNPWGNGRGNRGGNDNGGAPDLDDVIRKAQDSFRSMLPPGLLGNGLIFLALGAILLLWGLTGFYVVNPGEHAVIQRFGKWSRTQTEPGLGFSFPVPIETRTILNVTEIQKMGIGFIEGVSRTGQAGRRDVPEESLMLTVDRNVVDIDMVLQWNIKSAEDYLFNISDQENTIKKVAESAIREVVGQNDMFRIITTERIDVAQKTRDIIQKNLDDYKSGVNITQVLIEDAQVHPEVQGAFQDVQSAKQDAEDTQNRAGVYREDILPRARGQAIQMLQEAQGYKQSVVAKSNGDAQRFKSVLEAYQTGKDVTRERLFLETMESVFKNANKIIMDNSEGGQGVVPYLPLNELRKDAARAASESDKQTPPQPQQPILPGE